MTLINTGWCSSHKKDSKTPWIVSISPQPVILTQQSTKEMVYRHLLVLQTVYPIPSLPETNSSGVDQVTWYIPFSRTKYYFSNLEQRKIITNKVKSPDKRCGLSLPPYKKTLQAGYTHLWHHASVSKLPRCMTAFPKSVKNQKLVLSFTFLNFSMAFGRIYYLHGDNVFSTLYLR